MTFVSDDDGAVPQLKLRLEDDNGDYVKLRDSEIHGGEEASSSSSKGGLFCWWVKLVVLIIFLGAFAAVVLKWLGPVLMDKEVIPIINWEMKTFSTPLLAVMIVVSVALFPTLLLPSSPSMWLAGMTFGYGFGFLLIIPAAVVGVSLPYFIGSLFCHKLQAWLEKYPKKASIIRSPGDGNWLHQFRAVALIRISPFPYIIYNYCAAATNVKYGPYILGSLAGMVPEIFIAMYTGILIRALADASQDDQSLSAPQIIFNVLGFCATVGTTVILTIYAKRQLEALRKDEEPLLE